MITYWRWIGIGVGAVVLAGAVWWLWWQVPKRQMRSITLGDPKARADIEDNFRKTIGQALGGIAVLLGAVAAYLQFIQQQNAAHDLLISNQVAKGFEQLGSDKLTIRLGGIYALEGVMNTSLQYHQPVLEALCAFVREGTIGKVINGATATDIQAALTVVGRRSNGPGLVNLAEAWIARAALTGANLSGANLTHANLSGATLIKATLPGADLSGATLTNVTLPGADLSGAILTNVTLTNATLTGANLSGANLTHANLSGATLTKATLPGADLSGATLTNVTLPGADLSGATLTNVDLSGADLTHANLAEGNLTGANLIGADLTGANLPRANLQTTYLEGVDLTGANLADASLTDANLAGAFLTGANLSGTIGLSQAQLNAACGTSVHLPGRLTLDKLCPVRGRASPNE